MLRPRCEPTPAPAAEPSAKARRSTRNRTKATPKPAIVPKTAPASLQRRHASPSTSGAKLPDAAIATAQPSSAGASAGPPEAAQAPAAATPMRMSLRDHDAPPGRAFRVEDRVPDVEAERGRRGEQRRLPGGKERRQSARP